MKKVFYILLVLLVCSYTNVSAEVVGNNYSDYVSNSFIINRTTDPLDDFIESVDDPEETTCEGLFKNGDDFNDLGQALQDLFLAIEILAPALVIILSTIDYVKAIAASNQDQIKKVNQKTIKRLIAGLIIFFIPFLLDIIFELFGIYDLTTCGIGV